MTRDPVRGVQEGLTAADRQGVSRQDFFTKVGKILSTKTLIYHYIATALIQLGIQGYAFWMPTYLVRERGYDIAAAGKLAGIAMLAGGIIGALGGAIIADLWFRKDKTARLKVQTIAAAAGDSLRDHQLPCRLQRDHDTGNLHRDYSVYRDVPDPVRGHRRPRGAAGPGRRDGAPAAAADRHRLFPRPAAHRLDQRPVLVPL